jgi:hypothetical protein
MKNNDINKVISEELGKISKLFHYQRGKVISEQATDVNTDVGRMMRQLDAFNTNEDAVVNIIKRYNNKQTFSEFVKRYNETTGKNFGEHLYDALNPTRDKREWDELKNHLETFGVKLDVKIVSDPRKGKSSVIFNDFQPLKKKVTNNTNNSNIKPQIPKIALQNKNIIKGIQKTIGLPEDGNLNTQSIQKLITYLEN